MMSKMKKVGGLCLVLMVLASVMTGCQPKVEPTTPAGTAPTTTATAPTTPPAEPTIKQDEPAPPINLPQLDGTYVSLEDYKGKYVFVNFWATWCKFCVKEIPDLEAFDAANEDIVVLGVNSMESKAVVEKYVKDNKMKLPVVLDEKGIVSQQYMVSSYPTTFVLDKQGNLIGVVQGMLEPKQLESIKKLIHEKYPD